MAKNTPSWDSMTPVSDWDNMTPVDENTNETAKSTDGNFVRGFKNSFRQLPQLAYGLEAAAGATGENIAGQGGLFTGLKEHGLKNYRQAEQDLAQYSNENDSLTTAWGKAKQGDIGALGDWAGQGLGYVAGQGAQALATAGAGKLLAQKGVQALAPAIIENATSKEAAKLAAQQTGKELTEQELGSLAAQNAIGKVGRYGTNLALGANALGMEGGEIGGGLVDKADKENRLLTGEELAKAGLSTLGAGALEFVGDKIGLEAAFGKLPLGKTLSEAKGPLGRALRGAAGGAVASVPEAGTEYGQTLIEEYGKGNDPFSPESLRGAADAAALGALGGGLMGGVGGVVSPAQQPEKGPLTKAAETADISGISQKLYENNNDRTNTTNAAENGSDGKRLDTNTGANPGFTSAIPNQGFGQDYAPSQQLGAGFDAQNIKTNLQAQTQEPGVAPTAGISPAQGTISQQPEVNNDGTKTTESTPNANETRQGQEGLLNFNPTHQLLSGERVALGEDSFGPYWQDERGNQFDYTNDVIPLPEAANANPSLRNTDAAIQGSTGTDPGVTTRSGRVADAATDGGNELPAGRTGTDGDGQAGSGDTVARAALGTNNVSDKNQGMAGEEKAAKQAIGNEAISRQNQPATQAAQNQNTVTDKTNVEAIKSRLQEKGLTPEQADKVIQTKADNPNIDVNGFVRAFTGKTDARTARYDEAFNEQQTATPTVQPSTTKPQPVDRPVSGEGDGAVNDQSLPPVAPKEIPINSGKEESPFQKTNESTEQPKEQNVKSPNPATQEAATEEAVKQPVTPETKSDRQGQEEVRNAHTYLQDKTEDKKTKKHIKNITAMEGETASMALGQVLQEKEVRQVSNRKGVLENNEVVLKKYELKELDSMLKDLNKAQASLEKTHPKPGVFQHETRARATTRSANAGNAARMRDDYKKLLKNKLRSLLTDGKQIPQKYLDAIGASIEYDENGNYAPIQQPIETKSSVSESELNKDTSSSKAAGDKVQNDKSISISVPSKPIILPGTKIDDFAEKLGLPRDFYEAVQTGRSESGAKEYDYQIAEKYRTKELDAAENELDRAIKNKVSKPVRQAAEEKLKTAVKNIASNAAVKEPAKSTLAQAIEDLSNYSGWTQTHSENVARIASDFAAYFSGKDSKFSIWMREAVILHDAGKKFISKDILDKKGRLDAKERLAMARHSGLGAKYLESKGADRLAVLIARYHHVRLPYIPRLSQTENTAVQMAKIADVFEALTSKERAEMYRGDELASGQVKLDDLISRTRALTIMLNDRGMFQGRLLGHFIEHQLTDFSNEFTSAEKQQLRKLSATETRPTNPKGYRIAQQLVDRWSKELNLKNVPQLSENPIKQGYDDHAIAPDTIRLDKLVFRGLESSNDKVVVMGINKLAKQFSAHVSEEMYRDSTPETQAAIKADYERSGADNFHSWLVDNAAHWLIKQEYGTDISTKSKGLIKAIADKVKALWESIKADYNVAPSVEEFLNGIVTGKPVVKGSLTVEAKPTAQPKAESKPEAKQETIKERIQRRAEELRPTSTEEELKGKELPSSREAKDFVVNFIKDQKIEDVKEAKPLADKAFRDKYGVKPLDVFDGGNMMRGDDFTRAVFDGVYEAIKERGATLPVPVKETDVDRTLFRRAFDMTSHSPEERGDSQVEMYVRDMIHVYDELSKLAKTESQKAYLNEAFAGYKDKYVQKLSAYMAAHSNVMSSMITGPARFPVARNEKRSRAADARMNELIEYSKKATKAIEKAIINDGKVAKTPLEEVRQNLAGREKSHEMMKAANVVMRDKKLSEEQKHSKLVEIGLSDKQASEIMKPDFAGRTGFATYSLQNNLAEIKRLQQRVKELEAKEQAKQEQVEGKEEVYSFEGGRVEINYSDNRVRIFHDEKPSSDVITNLKEKAFKWSPTNKAWQRQITDNAINAALNLTGAKQETEVSAKPADNTKYSRTQSTKAAYEKRIDELFETEQANIVGVKVLDRSDMLDLMGYGGKPVRVVESKVIDSKFKHHMTADAWKNLPDWLDNPALVFDSDTRDGRLVFIAPETLKGDLIRIVLEPKENAIEAHMLVNAYDVKTDNAVMGRWLKEGLLRYIDMESSLDLRRTAGLQLPRVNTYLSQGVDKARSSNKSSKTVPVKAGLSGTKKRILTRYDLVKYRNTNSAKLSTGSQSTGSTVADITKALPRRVKGLLDAGKLKVVQSIEGLPAYLQERGTALYHAAWHGSPHDHDKFDLSKIGTGEGNQSFGYGLYFSDRKDIAEYYKEALGSKALNIDSSEFELDGFTYYPEFDKGKFKYFKVSTEFIRDPYKRLSEQKEITRNIALNALKKSNHYNGRLYQVELTPTADEYLDWDKPLSEQSDKVKSLIDASDINEWHNNNNTTGEDYYKWHSKNSSQEDASAFLHSLGIRGIRYKAEGGKSDANNYVIFSDEDISITAKYSKLSGVEALYDNKRDELYLVADMINKDTLNPILSHELLHRGLAQDPQLKAAHQRFEATMQNRFNAAKNGHGTAIEKEAYNRVINANTPVKDQLEEFSAYQISIYSKNPDSITGVIRKAIQDLIAAIRVFLIRNGLDRGFINSLTPADLAAMSRYGAKVASSQAVSGKLSPQFSIAPAQKSALWTRWFGRSKMVSKGEPIKFYRGDAEPITYLDNTKLGQNTKHTTAQLGHFFTRDKAEAYQYGGNVQEFFIAMQTPYVVTTDLLDKRMGNDPAKFAAKLKKEGFDGIFIKDINQAVIFDSNQAKLTSNKSPTFGEDIRYSKASDVIKDVTKQGDDWLKSFLSQEHKDALIYNLQDRFIDLKRQIEKVVKNGGTIKEESNPYLSEELYHQRTASRIKEFYDTEINPLLKSMYDNGIDKEDFEQFLHARHAPSRNAVMAERNPNQAIIDANKAKAEKHLDEVRNNPASKPKQISDALAEYSKWNKAKPFNGTEEDRLSLSGMTDQQAGEYMDSLPVDKRIVMEELGDKIDAINNETLDLLTAYNMEKPETIDALKNQWEHYVPLHRDEAHPDENNFGHPIGRGFSVRGAGMKNATGSNAEVTNILAHIAAAREQMLRRGEKNRVSKALAEFVKENPDDNFATVDAVDVDKKLNKEGLVEPAMEPIFKRNMADNVVMYRVSGKDHAIVFNKAKPENVRLALSLKNLDGANLDTVESLIAKGTRWFAKVNTQYNFVFGLFNLWRDTEGMTLNLSNTELHGKQLDVLKNMRDKAFKAIYQSERDIEGADPELKALYERFNKAGGTTGYSQMFDNIGQRNQSIANELKKFGYNKPMRMAQSFVKALSDFNTLMENSTRLAVFMTAVDNNMSDAKAASLAKNVTVNFNRKGAQTTKIGAFYAFFNASAQGTVRMMETMKGPKGKQILMGGIALGMMTTLLGLIAMGDDDWEKIPEFVRERSLIIPTGGSHYIAIPMPLGFHIIPNIGRKMVEAAFGSNRVKPTQRFMQLAGSIVGAFNPLGGSDISEFIMPTVLDPALSLWRNKDWTGRSIYMDDFNKLKPTPGFTRAKNTASATGTALAKGINKLTGGTDYTPGAWSPTPDQIDYVFGQLSGGTGREFLKAEETVSNLFSDDELPLHKVPLLGRIAGETQGNAVERSAYYENVLRMNEHSAELKGLLSEPNGMQKRIEYLKDNPEAKLTLKAQAIEKIVNRLNDRKRKLSKLGKSTKEIDNQIVIQMKKLNDSIADNLN